MKLSRSLAFGAGPLGRCRPRHRHRRFGLAEPQIRGTACKRAKTSFPLGVKDKARRAPEARRGPAWIPHAGSVPASWRGASLTKPSVWTGPSTSVMSRRGRTCLAATLALPAVSQLGSFCCQSLRRQTCLRQHPGENASSITAPAPDRGCRIGAPDIAARCHFACGSRRPAAQSLGRRSIQRCRDDRFRLGGEPKRPAEPDY